MSPTGLVKFLTYQSGRPKRPGAAVVLGCGTDQAGREDRAAAESLVSLGAKAVPAIEEGLDSINTWKGNPRWLLYAYARIQGPATFARLWAMYSNPESFSFQLSLDDALALSFGLTSYVSSFRPSVRVFCHSAGPVAALDQLVLAWEKGDRRWLEACLGPHAKAALNSLMEGRTWAAMRAELWHGPPSGEVAVGYRFEIRAGWAEPEWAWEDYTGGSAYASDNAPELNTRFATRTGGACGQESIGFLKAPGDPPPGDLTYLVDQSRIESLLRLIGSCATIP